MIIKTDHRATQSRIKLHKAPHNVTIMTHKKSNNEHPEVQFTTK